MELIDLDKYITYLKKLKRANSSAPHKPILLLSIFQAIQSGLIDNPFFKAEPELVALYNANFLKHVKTKHNTNFTMPFTKMNSEPFWRVVFKKGFEYIDTKIVDIKSFVALNNMILGVELDADFFKVLTDKDINEQLCSFIIYYYFPESEYKGYDYGFGNDFDRTIDNMLSEPSAEYFIDNKGLIESNNEDALAIRGAAFKRMIQKVYDYECSITGWRLQINANISMIDSCHIKPFSVSYDDTIGNGIALCPNLHRAFDRGLITISEQYTVLVSKNINENYGLYSLRNLEGKAIKKPLEKQYWPNISNLEYHRDIIFLG